MKTKAKKLSDTRVEITVTLDAADLKPAREQALKELAKEVKVEGFRKGKVPTEIAEKFIPENDVNAAAIDIAVRGTVIEAFRKESKAPLVIPNVNVTKYVPNESAEYTATADIVPEIKLGDYKKLGVKKPEVKVAEKDVKEVLDNLANSFAEKKVVKRAAKLGDETVIDFVGKKDGVAFNGGAAKDYKLTLGSGMFIPGFEDGIVGHEVGDKFDLELTFPKDYGTKDLAGAKVVFEVLLKQVNEVTKAKIDDEMAQKCGPFKTLDELKEDIKKNLQAQKEYQVLEGFKDDLLKALVKKSTVSAPEILIEDQLKMIHDDIERNAAASGLGVDEFLEMNGENPKEWAEESHKLAETRVKASLILQTLAVEAKIQVAEEEVAAKIAELRDVYKKSPEALKNLKDPNVKMDIKNRMTIEKALEFLVKENTK